MKNKNGASRTRRGSTTALKSTRTVARAVHKSSGGDAAHASLESQATDGRSSPDTTKASAQAGGGVQSERGLQTRSGLADFSGDDEARMGTDSRVQCGSSPPDLKVPSKDGGEVQAHLESHASDGLADYSDAEVAQPTIGIQPSDGQSASDSDERGAAHIRDESQSRLGCSAFTTDISALQEGQVRRKFCISLINKQTNAAKALVRRYCGFNSNIEQDEATREKINKRAAKIVECVLSGKDLPPEDSAVAERVVVDLNVVADGLAPLLARRAVIEKEMRRVARELPVYSWAKEIRGLGDLGLAVIIAEAGDLANYPHWKMLWKRLGLAPYDGHAFSHYRAKGALSAEEWTTAGYAPRRRAEIHACVGDPLLKAQGKDGPYRAIYDERRLATAVAHPDWTKAHSHGDAMRIMTKKLLADLWQAWRGSVKAVEASTKMARASSPMPDIPQDAEPVTAPRKQRRGSNRRLKASEVMARADSIPGM